MNGADGQIGGGPAGKISAINCTNCGAGLPVLGGGRVVMQVCGYCGAALDATDAFRVLEVYTGMTRPATPFTLGMEGEVEGVHFTIVGIKGMMEPGYGHWVDHMLYSPTHGYAWLTLEDGHLVFTRKVRDQPKGKWLTVDAVEKAEVKPGRTHRGYGYVYHETSNWVIDFVEGAFNYRPHRRDTGTSIAMVHFGDRPQMLTYVTPATSGAEREIEISRYAQDAAASFGVELPEPESVHPLQSYRARPGEGFYKPWFGAMVAASLVLWVAVTFLMGTTHTLYDGPVTDLPVEAALSIEDDGRPMRVRVKTDISNGYVELPFSLETADGAFAYKDLVPISYYFGSDWSEGSRSEAFSVAPHPGVRDYVVKMEGPDGPDARRLSNVTLTVKEGTGSMIWPILALVAFLFALAWAFLARTRFQMARTATSDWDEE